MCNDTESTRMHTLDYYILRAGGKKSSGAMESACKWYGKHRVVFILLVRLPLRDMPKQSKLMHLLFLVQ